jgi:hypothetical protein
MEPDAADGIGSAQQQIALRFGPPEGEFWQGMDSLLVAMGASYIDK